MLLRFLLIIPAAAGFLFHHYSHVKDVDIHQKIDFLRILQNDTIVAVSPSRIVASHQDTLETRSTRCSDRLFCNEQGAFYHVRFDELLERYSILTDTGHKLLHTRHYPEWFDAADYRIAVGTCDECVFLLNSQSNTLQVVDSPGCCSGAISGDSLFLLEDYGRRLRIVDWSTGSTQFQKDIRMVPCLGSIVVLDARDVVITYEDTSAFVWRRVQGSDRIDLIGEGMLPSQQIAIARNKIVVSNGTFLHIFAKTS